MRAVWGFLVGCLIAVTASAFAADDVPQDREFFEARVRPLLVSRCQGCHGAKKQESGLRLDTKAGLTKGGDGGVVVVAGQPDVSEFVKAIRREGGLKMPPDQPLPAAEIETLVVWIRRGAYWPEETTKATSESLRDAAKKHWAFQPIVDPALPRIPDDAWSQSPIDRFVLAKLTEAKLAPSSRADKRTLLRRMTFNLIGLPPTTDELAEYEADESPNAFERVVDRLLASPHYGERWGRHWLDVARYADTKGYVFFEEKKFQWGWTYRDYVLRSLNADVPFDRFVIEQLAADQLDLAEDKRPLTAMGFLTLGGRFMNNLHDVLDDRIDVVTRGLLGLTATCARCHDHKFDPIPSADYYSLYGIFRSSVEPTLPPEFLPTPQSDEYSKFSTEMNARLKKLKDFVSGKHTALVTSARTRAAEYLLAAQTQMEKPPQDDFMLIADTNDVNPAMTLRWQVTLEAAKKKPHPIWAAWTAFAELPPEQFETKASEVVRRLGTLARPGGGVVDEEHAKDKNEDRVSEATAKNGRPTSVNPLVITAACEPLPKSLSEVATRYGELLKRIDAKWHAELAAATAANQPPPLKLADPHEEEIRRVLYGPDAPPDVPLALGWGFLSLFPDRATQGEYQKLVKEVETWSMTTAGAPARAMVLVDDTVPFDPKVFLRGNPNRLGQAVLRQGLEIASPDRKAFSHGSGRLELAQSIVDPRNPLAARVFVNRVWLQHFGAGLVKTPSDFGLRSDPPSHPELLDWLAANFIKSGWSIKWLHRTILLSATYQQPSRLDPSNVAHRTADPENRLLSHMNRRRLDWEGMRDALLASSGEMNRQIGGESLNVLNGFVPRRTLYGLLDRLDVPNLLTTFDFPSPAASNPQRDETTVAPQALFLMNGDLSFEVASRLLRRTEIAHQTEMGVRLKLLFQACFQRSPASHEEQAARDFLGESPSAERWLSFAQSLLLTNEFVFVD